MRVLIAFAGRSSHTAGYARESRRARTNMHRTCSCSETMAIYTRFGSEVTLCDARLIPIWIEKRPTETKWHYTKPTKTGKNATRNTRYGTIADGIPKRAIPSAITNGLMLMASRLMAVGRKFKQSSMSCALTDRRSSNNRIKRMLPVQRTSSRRSWLRKQHDNHPPRFSTQERGALYR